MGLFKELWTTYLEEKVFEGVDQAAETFEPAYLLINKVNRAPRGGLTSLNLEWSSEKNTVLASVPVSGPAFSCWSMEKWVEAGIFSHMSMM